MGRKGGIIIELIRIELIIGCIGFIPDKTITVQLLTAYWASVGLGDRAMLVGMLVTPPTLIPGLALALGIGSGLASRLGFGLGSGLVLRGT